MVSYPGREALHAYIEEHPRALYAVTLPLIALAMYQLVEAVRLHERARDLVGQLQLARSEALGG